MRPAVVGGPGRRAPRRLIKNCGLQRAASERIEIRSGRRVGRAPRRPAGRPGRAARFPAPISRVRRTGHYLTSITIFDQYLISL